MSNGLGAGLGDNFVRAHVHYPEVDAKLLSYLSTLAGSEPMYPASFPIVSHLYVTWRFVAHKLPQTIRDPPARRSLRSNARESTSS